MPVPRRKTFVYFVQPEMGGPIKIGVSEEPMARLQTLMSWSPYPLKLLARFSGDRHSESFLHRRFAEHRIRGEWFHPVVPLLDLIGFVQEHSELPPVGYEHLARDREPYGRLGAALATTKLPSATLAARLGVGKQSVYGWCRDGVPFALIPEVVGIFYSHGHKITEADLRGAPPERVGSTDRRAYEILPAGLAALHGRVSALRNADELRAILTAINELIEPRFGWVRRPAVSERVRLAPEIVKRHVKLLILQGILVGGRSLRFSDQIEAAWGIVRKRPAQSATQQEYVVGPPHVLAALKAGEADWADHTAPQAEAA